MQSNALKKASLFNKRQTIIDIAMQRKVVSIYKSMMDETDTAKSKRDYRYHVMKLNKLVDYLNHLNKLLE